MVHRSIIAVFISILCFVSTGRASDMVYPSPDIAPADVISIQLNGLQYNDTPEVDFGISQTWAFAHPRNRAATGPLSRFTIMLKGPGFGMMLNHASHKITLVKSGESRQQFEVFMEGTNGDVLQFAWVVEKVIEGRFKDCWMTVAVSVPQLIGQGS